MGREWFNWFLRFSLTISQGFYFNIHCQTESHKHDVFHIDLYVYCLLSPLLLYFGMQHCSVTLPWAFTFTTHLCKITVTEIYWTMNRSFSSWCIFHLSTKFNIFVSFKYIKAMSINIGRKPKNLWTKIKVANYITNLPIRTMMKQVSKSGICTNWFKSCFGQDRANTLVTE